MLESQSILFLLFGWFCFVLFVFKYFWLLLLFYFIARHLSFKCTFSKYLRSSIFKNEQNRNFAYWITWLDSNHCYPNIQRYFIILQHLITYMDQFIAILFCHLFYFTVFNSNKINHFLTPPFISPTLPICPPSNSFHVPILKMTNGQPQFHCVPIYWTHSLTH